MCGIAGAVATGDRPLVGDDVIRRMTDCLAHRGPDDDGFYRDARAALGFRRLSIIDLTTGHQPVQNEDGSVWTILNGEIYNYKELRQALVLRGHRFHTQSDTEVLVHLYEDRGEAMVDELRGMFAFCIWDARRQRMLLARDHLGVKPLFYAVAGGHLYFASEIKAILATGLVDRTIDVAALDHYLGLQYVPAPMTIYAGIRALPPGHLLRVADGQSDVRQYWDLTPGEQRTGSLDACAEEYDAALVESVRLQLRSDVPVGAFLSGGVDSSAVVAIMAGLSDAPVNTFTIGNRVAAFDESADARLIADRFGTRHHNLVIGPEDFLRLVPAAIEQYDQPFADSSALPTFLVSQLAREHVKVVLSGDGSDETCGGYARYGTLARLRAADRLPWRHLVPDAARRALDAYAASASGRAGRGARGLLALMSSEAERHYYLMSYFRSSKHRLYGPALAKAAVANADIALFERHLAAMPAGDPLRRILYLDIKTYLPGDILYKVDIASMASSLEVRVPFLDHKLVELAAAIPSRYKVMRGHGKYFLKRVMERRLPHDTLYRTKRGFEIPVSAWFRNELAPFLREALLESALLRPPWFERGAVETLVNDHQAGRADHGPRLWILMALALWHRRLGGSFAA